MDRPKIKHGDWDDSDFDELEGECECGNWKNANKKECDSCRFSKM